MRNASRCVEILYDCTGGVIEVGFLRSDGLGMAKAQGKRHSRLILGEVFLEIAFSCLCVIVYHIARKNLALQDSSRKRNYSTLLFSCRE